MNRRTDSRYNVSIHGQGAPLPAERTSRTMFVDFPGAGNRESGTLKTAIDLLRGNIRRLAGYTPGEQPQSLDVLKLNTNENPYPPAPAVMAAIAAVAPERLRRYPDPLARSFREAAGTLHDVSPECIVAANGGDDALTILTRAFLEMDDLLVAASPTYPLYEVLAQIHGCRFEARGFAPDWSLPVGFLLGCKLAFLPNPNSPSGTWIKPELLRDIARQGDGILVVDETYADFAGDSCMRWVEECDRLVVTRSLSKTHSLAGLRFGYAVANRRLVETLVHVKDSYNCDAISIAAATAAIGAAEYTMNVREKILATRTRMESALAALGFEVTPSSANFVWVRHEKPVEPIYRMLKERNILVRYLRFAGYGDGLRISVGTDDQIDRLLAELEAIMRR